MNEHAHLTGPDFLEKIAEAALKDGMEINYAEFKRREKQWRDLEAKAEQLETANQSLQDRLDQFTRLAKAA